MFEYHADYECEKCMLELGVNQGDMNLKNIQTITPFFKRSIEFSNIFDCLVRFWANSWRRDISTTY